MLHQHDVAGFGCNHLAASAANTYIEDADAAEGVDLKPHLGAHGLGGHALRHGWVICGSLHAKPRFPAERRANRCRADQDHPTSPPGLLAGRQLGRGHGALEALAARGAEGVHGREGLARLGLAGRLAAPQGVPALAQARGGRHALGEVMRLQGCIE